MAGQIYFLHSAEAAAQTEPSAIVQSTEFRYPGSDELWLRVYLPHPLLTELIRLAPELAEEELVANGNFNFTFLVDDQVVYTENLHPGAFGTTNKQTATTFRLPLATSKKVDSWGWFLWQRFLANGGHIALSEGKHALTIQIGSYINPGSGKSIVQGPVIATGKVTVNVRETSGRVKSTQLQLSPLAPEPGLQLSSYPVDTQLLVAMKSAIYTQRIRDIQAIVVLKEGKLWLEEYFHSKRNDLHDPRSVSKSVLSAVMGIALEDGRLRSIDQRLSEFFTLRNFAHYSPTKDSITLKQLLTMSSGFDGDDEDPQTPGNEEQMYVTSNWTEFVLNLPLRQSLPKVPEWSYFTGGVVVLGDVINSVVPGGLEKYTREKLFTPLQITQYSWPRNPQGQPNTAGGLQLRAIDYAKFGQLYRNGGLWNGKQVLSKKWVDASLSRQVVRPGTSLGYGFLFWEELFQINGRDYRAFVANGNGGNKVVIFQELNAVLVIASTAYNTPYGTFQSRYLIEHFLLPALVK